MKKRCFLLCFALVCLFSMPSIGEEKKLTAGLFEYTINKDGNVIITDFLRNKDEQITSVTIPDKISNHPVVGIGQSAFSSCQYLTSINLPNSITSIGPFAFNWCVRLSGFTIADNIADIGEAAFDGCYSMQYVNISPSHPYYEIVDGALYDKQKKMLVGLFHNICNSNSFQVKDGTTAIGSYAFENSILQSIQIPDSVTYIGDYAFNFSKKLQSITLPKNIESISTGMFQGCLSLESLVIPDGVKIINSYAFDECTKLTNINIPVSVIEIGDSAFSECTNLLSITIPSNVTKIGMNIFAQNPQIVLYVAEGSIAYSYAITYQHIYNFITN